MKKDEQINYALVAKGHTPMYVMHKYWARKNPNVISQYIQHYSTEGDIVFDPFCGSGPVPIEAIKLKRKGIGVDLDPMATFITRMTAAPVNISEVKSAFGNLEKECKKQIYDLYKTKCQKCSGETIINTTHIESGRPIKILYSCKGCGKQEKEADKADFNLLKKIEKMEVPYWHPTTKLYYGVKGFLKKERSETITDLFSKRNLIALSILLEHLKKIPDQKIRDGFLFAFSSGIHLSSKLLPLSKKHGTWSGWTLHSFWVPKLRIERNVWNVFEDRYNAFLRGKEDSNKQIRHYKEANKFNDLNNEANILIKTYNALELDDVIPPNSVDYIFTDPPYGGSVQYFELSSIWASWLGMNLNFADEITINKQQSKNFEYYHKMLKAAFREMYRVLKQNKYLTVTFHSTDIAVWNSIIKAVVLSGFDLEKIIYQPPARPSAKSYYQPYGSAVGDYYIRFKKPASKKIVSESQMDMQSYERKVVLAAKRIIEERGEPTIYQHLLNGIMVELKGGRYAPIGARKFEAVLKANVNEEFELIPIKDSKGKTVGKKWWLKGRDFSNFTTPALSDRVEQVIITVLDKKIKASFDDVLQEIFMTFPNALTPDKQDIKSIVEEYAIKTKDGKWRLKPELQEKERTSNHSKMIYYLATLGKKAGFDIWIGLREQGESYGGKMLKELSDKIRAFRFVSQEASALDRIKMIDILWLEDGRIKYEFEVENTTGISEAIIRGSNIPEELRVKRFIVIPKERERKLNRKLQEPILQQAVQKNHWQFIRYQDLETLYKGAKKKFNPRNIQKISKMPEDKPAERQTSLF